MRKGAENLTTKEFLMQAFELDRLVKSKKYQINLLKEQLINIKLIIGGAHQANRDSVDILISLIADLENEYLQDVIRLLYLKTSIATAIEKIENPTQRLILNERYVHLKHWNDIAIDTNYSWNAVHKIHRTGLDSIVIDPELLNEKHVPES